MVLEWRRKKKKKNNLGPHWNPAAFTSNKSSARAQLPQQLGEVCSKALTEKLISEKCITKPHILALQWNKLEFPDNMLVHFRSSSWPGSVFIKTKVVIFKLSSVPKLFRCLLTVSISRNVSPLKNSDSVVWYEARIYNLNSPHV